MESMTVSNGPAARRRAPAVWIVGGCAALLVCAGLACAALAVYWTLTGAAGGLLGPRVDLTPVAFASLPAGVAADGQSKFAAAGCSACHSLQPSVTTVGPSLAGIGVQARTRKPNYSAEEYLLESIINPNAYVDPSFQRGIMPGTYQSQFSDQELADLVAFLLTQ